MDFEKEWLEGLRSGKNYKLIDVFEVVTPEIADKYKEEIVAKIDQDLSLITYLPMEIRKAWPEVCLAVVEKDPYYICYVPEEIIKSKPEILDRVSDDDWDELVNGTKFTNMPVEIVEKNYNRIKNSLFRLSEDGSSRMSKDVCDKYPEFVERAFERTLYTGGNIKALRESLPREILEKHKEEIDKIEKLISEREEVQTKIAEAKKLDDKLNREIRSVRESIVERYKGDSEDGAR